MNSLQKSVLAYNNIGACCFYLSGYSKLAMGRAEYGIVPKPLITADDNQIW